MQFECVCAIFFSFFFFVFLTRVENRIQRLTNDVKRFEKLKQVDTFK